MGKLIAIVIIVFAAGGIYWYGQNSHNRNEIVPDRDTATTSSPTPTPPIIPPANTVIYTDSGYVSRSFTIRAGTTISFQNQSSRLMWTASDPHPTHTIMAEFDQLKGIPDGQSYSFTFTKKGTWRYHNHLSPGHTGSIFVE